MRWLERLANNLKTFYMANQAELSQATRQQWDSSTHQYVNSVLPLRVDERTIMAEDRAKK